MARIATTWEAVRDRYPEQIQEIVARLRKSESKFKKAAPEDLWWSFSVAWRCDEQYLGSNTDAASMYLWELGRVEVYFCGEAPTNRGCGWSAGVHVEVPDEVKAHLKERVEKMVKDNLEYAALSPEEKQKRFEEALKYLSGQPGFFAVHV